MKALLYCTKAKPYLYGHYVGFETKWQYDLTKNNEVFNNHKVLNGFIVAECEIDKVEEIKHKFYGSDNIGYHTWTLTQNDLCEKSCLNFGNLYDYIWEYDGYALHLSNVKAFDEPKDISLFYTNYCIDRYGITSCNMLMKAPQNMCRVIDFEGKPYVLISIRPEWLCKILNGEKTIEVRKQILNCLKEMI